MSKRGAYRATSASLGMYGGFFKDVCREAGLEKAVAWHANQGKHFGAQIAGALKQELGRKKLNVATLESVYAAMIDLLGFAPKIEKTRSTLRMTISQCPVYDGLSSAGLDHKTIELMCNGLAAAEMEALKNAFPNLTGCVKFRATLEEACVEEYVIAK